jgi:hypothetical protein
MNKKKKIFLIDIDGVACDHAKGICDRVNVDYCLNYCFDDVQSWDFDFGPITFVEAVNKYYQDPEFILSLPVHAGFSIFLQSIEGIAFVEFATNRNFSRVATESWVNKNLGEYPVYFVSDKTELNYDCIIDDHQDIVIKSAELGKISFLISRPWNTNKKTLRKIESARNAFYICDYLQAIPFVENWET